MFCRSLFLQPGSFSLQYLHFWYNLDSALCFQNLVSSFPQTYSTIIYDFTVNYFHVQCGVLKAFKRAAESLEKLLDVTREELPDTMAAVRLSGMEISDLTMELSDLGLVLNIKQSLVTSRYWSMDSFICYVLQARDNPRCQKFHSSCSVS